MNIIAWNIRGAKNKEGRRFLMDLCRRHKPEVLILVETYMMFDSTDLFWHRLGYKPVAVEECHGQAGGIWCLAQVVSPLTFDVMDSCSQIITIAISKGDVKWALSDVYASPIPSIWEGLW